MIRWERVVQRVRISGGWRGTFPIGLLSTERHVNMCSWYTCAGDMDILLGERRWRLPQRSCLLLVNHTVNATITSYILRKPALGPASVTHFHFHYPQP